MRRSLSTADHAPPFLAVARATADGTWG